MTKSEAKTLVNLTSKQKMYIDLYNNFNEREKSQIKETKKEIAFIENPNGLYDLLMNEELPDADEEKATKVEDGPGEI